MGTQVVLAMFKPTSSGKVLQRRGALDRQAVGAGATPNPPVQKRDLTTIFFFYLNGIHSRAKFSFCFLQPSIFFFLDVDWT